MEYSVFSIQMPISQVLTWHLSGTVRISIMNLRYSDQLKSGWKSWIRCRRLGIFNIKLWLDLDIRALIIASRTNLESGPQFNEVCFRTFEYQTIPIFGSPLYSKFLVYYLQLISRYDRNWNGSFSVKILSTVSRCFVRIAQGTSQLLMAADIPNV